MITQHPTLLQGAAAGRVTALNGEAPLSLALYTGIQPEPGEAPPVLPVAVLPVTTPLPAPVGGAWALPIVGNHQVTLPGGPHTVTWARLSGENGWLMDFEVGSSGSGKPIIIEEALYQGGLVTITSAALYG